MKKFYVLLTVLICEVAFLAAAQLEPAQKPSADQLMQLIRANKLDELRKIASAPGVANITDSLNSTPLHYAAIYGSPDSVRVLLDAGADPNARNQQQATPLVYASWDFEKTRLLVDKGAQVNVATTKGVTPLMVAASASGNSSSVRYLLDRGADIRALDAFHGDALMRAAGMADVATLKLLIEKGANPHLANQAGIDAMQNATAFPDCERVRLLLAAGADSNTFNTGSPMMKNGPIALIHLTPLMLAAPHSNRETLSVLLEAGAHVNELDIRKMSPLTLAIATDHASPDTVRQLIGAGADVNAKDQNGESVLDWARKFRNPEILSALEKAGARGREPVASPQPPADSQPRNPSDAIGRALPLLSKSSPEFFQASGGCAGCHHQPIAARAYAAVSYTSSSVDQSLRRSFLDAMVAFRPRLRTELPLLQGPGGDYDPLLAAMMTYADLHEPADRTTDLIVHYIAVRQDPSGAWINLGIARPPIEDSTISRTAMAIRTLELYGWPARKSEFNERINRARAWLQSAQPVTVYEEADRLMGLHAAGVPASELRADARVLLSRQRADGGWPQTRYLDSDAYGTGLVLHTLYTTGLLSPNDPRYQKGIAFLLRTQFPDGSWYVRSRAPKFQPYFQSGFPFEHDQWISSTATAYAVMALAPAAFAVTSR